jgi:hypothetical protein
MSAGDRADAPATKALGAAERWRARQLALAEEEIRWVRRLIRVRHVLGLGPIQTELFRGRTRYAVAGERVWAAGLPGLVARLEAAARRKGKVAA